ncbi:MAG: hypothetical protein JXA89_26615, partial [Anaerolineae bacterium]|nr:hypothetical protein [Anaerolineae bacterium]
VLVPVVAAIGLPVLLPHLANLSAMGSSAGLPSNARPSTVNSLIAMMPLWMWGIPAAYLAALSISLLKPLGKIGTRLLFLLILMGSAVPVRLLLLPFLDAVRWLQLIGTTVGLMFPYLVSGAAFYVFKLFFDGREQAWRQAARDKVGASPAGVFFQQIILPSLPVLLLVMVAVAFAAAIGGLDWMWASMTRSDRVTYPLILVMLGSQMRANQAALAAYALRWTVMVFGLLVIPAVLLQILFVDRLALVGKD